MLLLYATKKLIKLSSFIVILFFLIFSLLQITKIQEIIINTILRNDCKVELIESKGIFPFDFIVKKIKVNGKDFDFNMDDFYIHFAKDLTGIKKIEINKAELKNNNQSNLNTDYIGTIFSVVSQKYLKKIFIKEFKYNDNTINNLDYSSENEMNFNVIKFNISDINVCSILKTKDNLLEGTVDINNINLEINYDNDKRFISLITSLNTKKEFTFDGIIGLDYSIKGISYIDRLNTKIETNLKLNNSNLDLSLFSDYFKTKIKASYNFKKNNVNIKELIYDKGIFTLPFDFDFKDKKFTDIHFIFKKGRLDISNINLSKENFSLGDFKFKDIDTSDFSNINCLISGESKFLNNKENFSINLKKIEYENIKIPDIKLNGTYSKEDIDIKAFYNMLKKENKVEVNIKNNNWVCNKNSKLKIKANGIFDFKDFIRKGIFRYNITANGTLIDPVFSGNLSFDDGIYINKGAGTYIRNINLKSIIKNNKINIERISANDDTNEKGTISGKGSIEINKKGVLVDVGLNINNLEIMQMRELEARLFGILNIKGDLTKELKIKGDLYTEKAELDISNIISASIRGFSILNGKKEEKKVERNIINLKIPLDINFSFKPDFHIYGFGIDSRWTGGYKIYGDLNNIEYKGEIRLSRGVMSVSGKKCQLSDGIITTSNLNNGAYLVNLSASKNLGDVTVGARFIQNLKTSDVIFFSNPYLSKKDILSYLLFEKQASDISSSEGLTIFSVMSKLSGKENFDIIGKLKDVFSLDTFELKKNKDKSGVEHDAMRIGRSIGKMKISVDQGTGSEQTKVVVESEIRKNTKISVDLSSSDSVNAGILWHKRY